MITIASSNSLVRMGLVGAFACCMLAAGGCQNSLKEVVDVEGRVTYQGQAVSTGTISFSPKSVGQGTAQRPATAVLDVDGTYRLKAFRNQFGMPPGEYVVSILSYEGSMLEPSTVKYLVPKKFSDSGTSGLVATVPESHPGALKIDFNIQ